MPVRRLRVALNLRTGMLRNEIVIHGKQAATVCCTISSSYCSMSINELSWSTEQFNRSISLPNFKSILGRHVKVHVNKIILTHWQGAGCNKLLYIIYRAVGASVRTYTTCCTWNIEVLILFFR